MQGNGRKAAGDGNGAEINIMRLRRAGMENLGIQDQQAFDQLPDRIIMRAWHAAQKAAAGNRVMLDDFVQNLAFEARRRLREAARATA